MALVSVDGYQVKWQGYEFSVSIHPVHGLVLHQLATATSSTLSGGAVEMIVPWR